MPELVSSLPVDRRRRHAAQARAAPRGRGAPQDRHAARCRRRGRLRARRERPALGGGGDRQPRQRRAPRARPSTPWSTGPPKTSSASQVQGYRGTGFAGPPVSPPRGRRRRRFGGAVQAAARCRRSRTPSHSGPSGGVSTQISFTPCGVEVAQHREQLARRFGRVVRHAPAQRRAASGSCSTVRDQTAMRAASAPSTSSAVCSALASISRTLGAAARSATSACPRRAGRAPASSSGQRSRSPQAASICARVSDAGAQQHRRAAACSRRWSIRCRPRRARHRAPAASSPNSLLRRAAAVVGLTRPKRLALGAATPATPVRRRRPRSSACATGCDGQRRPMVSCPPAAAARHAGLARHDQRQRPGPEGLHQLLRERRQRLREARQRLAPVASGHVHDQRMVAGPALGGEDAGHGARRCRRRRPGRRPSRSGRRPARRRRSARAACVDGVGDRCRRGSSARQQGRAGPAARRPAAAVSRTACAGRRR